MDLISRVSRSALSKPLQYGTRNFAAKALHSSLFTHLPRFFKYAVYFLLFLNARSFPFAWHIRLFRPVIVIRLSYLMVKLRTVFMSPRRSEEEEDKWLDSICPVGQDPFTTEVPYHSWASIDDSDFNVHLSNSSYAKTCDTAGLGGALKVFPMFFHLGGYMALAATHFEFLKEIPMLSPYEVRVSIGSWDQKWMYMICKFVTKPKKKLKQIGSSDKSRNGKPIGTNGLSSAIGTDRVSSDPQLDSVPSSKPRNFKDLVEPDGAILHAFAVSQGCFKIGRITVPPALVLAINGFSVQPRGGSIQYSRENPPPTFLKAKKLMSKPLGGSPSLMREFLEGGWREVLEDKWWEDALCDGVEERRENAFDALNRLRTGFETVRS